MEIIITLQMLLNVLFMLFIFLQNSTNKSNLEIHRDQNRINVGQGALNRFLYNLIDKK